MSDESDNESSVWESDEENEDLSFLEIIGFAEEWLKDIKEKVARYGGEHSFAAAGQVSRHVKPLADMMNLLRKKTISRGLAAGQDLFDSFVIHNDMPYEPFWELFHEKLKVLEGSSVEFREESFHLELVQNKNSLLHQVCYHYPPVEVVKTLLDIIPEKDEETFLLFRRDPPYNHLHQNADGDYPLNLVLKHGGSFEVVKLLIDADEEKRSFGIGRNSILHQFVSNQANHEPNDFFKSLRLLVQWTTNDRGSLLLGSDDNKKLPLELLWKSLKDSGVSSNFSIVQNTSFQFLLKASWYARNYFTYETEDWYTSDEMLLKIDGVPLHEAWIACSTYFDSSIVKDVLKNLIPSNENFFLEKNQDGKYFMFNLLCKHQCFMGIPTWSLIRDIVETILIALPQAARLVNDESLLPLHVIADSARLDKRMTDAERLDFVRTIWKAYPEAVEVMHKHSRIAPFLLPLRDERDNKDETRSWYERPPTHSISSTFFLLQQRPEMIHRAVLVDVDTQKEKKDFNVVTTARPAKRVKT